MKIFINNNAYRLLDFIEELKRDLKNKDLQINALEYCLKKQIEVKPNIDGVDDNGNIIYDTYICPSCYARYEIDYDDYDYCPNCGQCFDKREID